MVTESSTRETLFHNEFDQALADEFFLQAWWRNTEHIVRAHHPLSSAVNACARVLVRACVRACVGVC
jgi:hypothetical protein